MQGRRKFWKSGREYALAVMCCGGHNLPLLPSWDRVTDPSKSEGGRAIAPPPSWFPGPTAMSAVVDISYWFDLRFLLTTTSNRNQSQCSSSFSLLNCCCMCQQDVLQRKIIICAKLHVFLGMCHTMQWSNGLTFFITEDLHFDEQYKVKKI